MADIDFERIKQLKPPAFKLYVYFLHQAHKTGRDGWRVSLTQLGWDSYLQVHASGWWPHQGHGKDGTVRRALDELIQQGLLAKTGGRGRRPNTYRLLRSPPSESQPQAP